MIHGCVDGSGGVGKPALVVAPINNHTAVRCPEVDARQRAALKRKVGPPKREPDGSVSDDALKAKINELRLSDYRKGQIGLAIADELDRCRGQAASPEVSP